MTRPPETTAPNGVVVVIDDDPSIRKALANLFDSAALQAQAFASPEDFLTWPVPDCPLCMVLDVRMPGQNGLDFRAELLTSRADVPTIFITAHGDIPMSVRAMKSGAIEFLTKPFKDEDLLDAVRKGLEFSRQWRMEAAARTELRDRHATLSARERQIMGLVVQGQLSKQIAAQLGLSEITVKVHRTQIMRKMQAASLLELGRIADQLERA